MKTVTYKGEKFLLENVSSFRFEVSPPAKVEMNAFTMREPRKESFLIITYTNGDSRTLTGQDAVALNGLLEKALR